jgi:mono/diheme cytochrome c family protein
MFNKFGVTVVLVGAVGLLLGSVSRTWAVKQFTAEFAAKYVKSDSTEPSDVAFRKAVEQAKCAICHQGRGKSLNTYGREVGKLLRKSDKNNKEKIEKALTEAATKKANPQDAHSPTFGELIEKGKLPSP